jgi:glycosyltransferase involved in cell wall biosynthesis
VAFLAETLLGPGGMGRYAREVLAALGRRDDLELLPIVPADARDLAGRLGGARVVGIETIRGRIRPVEGLWERYRLGAAVDRRGCDVVHGARHLVPRGPVPSVLTIHDVMALTSGHQFDLVKRVLLPAQFRRSIEDARVLVAVSTATGQRVATLLPHVADKVVVVPNGVGPDLLQVEPRSEPRLEGVEFALVVGDLSPRKNIDLLLEIWPRVHATTGLILVCVGPDGWHSRGTRRRLEHAVADGHAVRLVGVDDATLRWCYEHARVVCVPSVEEGFGLPVAEALALGAPVVASTDPALVEAGRGRALHLAPRDSAAWERALTETGADPDRRPLVPSSWDGHAAGLVRAYHRALGAAATRFG